MRINARLDSERTNKLRQIQALTGLTASDVVKQAIDLLYQQESRYARHRLNALLSSGFVGCAEGPEDLASQYKRYLTSDLEEKHGIG